MNTTSVRLAATTLTRRASTIPKLHSSPRHLRAATAVIPSPFSTASVHTSIPKSQLRPFSAATTRRQRDASQSQSQSENSASPNTKAAPQQSRSPVTTAPSRIYTFEEIQDLSTSPPTPTTPLLIDVREPSELISTGRIPTAVNLPLSSAPDAFFLPADEFLQRFGFEKPSGTGSSSTEGGQGGEGGEGGRRGVVFYCKAGVRSRAAAQLAREGGWSGVGEFPGSWMEWEGKGGKAER